MSRLHLGRQSLNDRDGGLQRLRAKTARALTVGGNSVVLGWFGILILGPTETGRYPSLLGARLAHCAFHLP